MRVVIAEIPEEGLRLTERLDPAALALDTPDLSFVAPLAVAAVVQRHDEELLVAVEADSTVAVVCSRCLAAGRRPYHGAFQLAVEIQRRPSVELNDELRQEILLSYPLRALCRDDCRGLCPACGHSMNEGPCRCEGRSLQKE
ncbi:MAG: DUF177 domain-containing protein [Candidatus Omnitrophica bacterium]|nr:DUF177 domain-containing protein [Candidatus Omnitrophota bacterium]